MAGTLPGRNMFVALGIQTSMTTVATVFSFFQPTEVGGFLEEFATIESNRRLGTRFTGMPYLGTKQVPFNFTVEANPDDIGRILLATMGQTSIATTTSAYLHTFKFAESLPYCTVYGYLAGVADGTGVDKLMRLTGGKINTLSIKGGIDDVMTVAVEGIAMIASALSTVTAAYSAADPWFLNSVQGTGVVSLGSTISTLATFGEAREFEIDINNGAIADHRIHGSATPIGISEGSSDLTGRMVAIFNQSTFNEITQYAAGNIRALALTVSGVTMMLSAPTQVRQLTIAMNNLRYSGDSPSYDPDVITIEFPFKAAVSVSTYISVLNDKSLVYSAAT
jgi:hypothetical protein